MDKSEIIVKFKLSSAEFEISGPEAFVRDQIESFKPNIEECLNQLAKSFSTSQALLPSKQSLLLPPKKNKMVPDERMEEIDFIEINNSVIAYENVLVIENGKVQIITDVPGESLAKRMIKLILIYTWGKLQLKEDEISFAELREVCEKHGEIDRPNFSKHIQMNKKFFITSGSGKNQAVKLIRPGIKEAIRIITELNNS